MKTQNKVQLIGYIGQDPKVITTAAGSTLVRIRIATDEFYKDASGNSRKLTTWHEIKVWDQLAAVVSGNFIKGSHILVEGKINYRTYEDKTGHLRFVTEIKASNLLNLDR
jgi:single-strand DNA-binding protein